MAKELIVSVNGREKKIAIIENDRVTEFYIERGEQNQGIVGNIYKGRVMRVLPGMQSAFVDIGLERDAFLCVEDVSGASEDDEPPADPAPSPAIEQLLEEGQEIVVQVIKDPVPHKGARIASHVSLPGRYLVHLPGIAHVGVSRRIEDQLERERLKSVVLDLARRLGIDGGFIVRTAAEGLAAEEFAVDARSLAGLWGEIRNRAMD